MFLAEPRNVVVAGIRRDGRPHLSPNWFVWDGQCFVTPWSSACSRNVSVVEPPSDASV